MEQWLANVSIKNAIFALVLLTIGLIIAKKVSRTVEKYAQKRFSKHHATLMRRTLFYFITICFVVSALRQLGFDLAILIGAAGVLSVAIGFASQTAASNFISGIFMIFERPYSIGDFIEIKGFSGTVETIDLISTKLRTTDNRLIRVPNETLIKSEIINYSFYPNRRIDLLIGINYDSDVEKAKTILLDIAESTPEVLEDPVTKVLVNNLADSCVELKLMAWVKRENFITTKSMLQQRTLEEFNKSGIDIPYPQLTINRPV